MKTIVIGGGNGIGLAIANEMAGLGNQVVVIDKCEPDCVLPKGVSFERYKLFNCQTIAV